MTVSTMSLPHLNKSRDLGDLGVTICMGGIEKAKAVPIEWQKSQGHLNFFIYLSETVERCTVVRELLSALISRG